ncbi:hypothetical protein ACTVKO_16855 [Serratia nevei]
MFIYFLLIYNALLTGKLGAQQVIFRVRQLVLHVLRIDRGQLKSAGLMTKTATLAVVGGLFYMRPLIHLGKVRISTVYAKAKLFFRLISID